MDHWSFAGLFGGCAYGAYIVIRGIRTGVVSASANHRKRTFRRGERYFTATLVMHSILVVTLLIIGVWQLFERVG